MTVVQAPLNDIFLRYKQGDIKAGTYLIRKYYKAIVSFNRQFDIIGQVDHDGLIDTVERILIKLKQFEL